MERGVYFDAWFPRQHCYHPSLPPRRLRMVDDLVDYKATVLVWSALGGGSISLPYLEQEAFGEIDPRFRFYGFVNDAEFIEACHQHGIKVFGIIFEAQGWEFPVELNEAEDRVLALNERRGVGKQDWLGLREFSQNRYPKLWPPFEQYFPDGLVNSDGEPVRDLLEEGCSRDIHGAPYHAKWVECPGHEHYCYYMDRNNPVWREYLKGIIRIQIDAGVDGIQLDEAGLPITALQFGGCFCRDCMKGFRAYLQDLPAEEFPEELVGVELPNFDYGKWLRQHDDDIHVLEADTPLFWDYLRFQRGAVARYFGELADYAHDYAASKGRNVLVSGNLFNLFDHFHAVEPKVDMIITEMRNTRYQQPGWYRYVAGFAGSKPTIVVENPYGGVVPELVNKLKEGKGYDLFRLSLYEAAAMGANMSVPYGAWLGSAEQDAFYAPHDLSVEIQRFLADHEHLFSHDTYNEVAVVYSVESNYQESARGNFFADNRDSVPLGEAVPFWSVCQTLADSTQPFDVLFFPDTRFRPDELTIEDLHQYQSLILPDCCNLTPAQADLVREYLGNGRQVLVLGELGLNLPEEVRRAILEHEQTTLIDHANGIQREDFLHGPQIQIEEQAPVAVNIQRVSAGVAVHIVHYDYDERQDCVPVLAKLTVEARIPGHWESITAYSPEAVLEASHTTVGDLHRLELRNVPLYGIVLLRNAAQEVG